MLAATEPNGRRSFALPSAERFDWLTPMSKAVRSSGKAHNGGFKDIFQLTLDKIANSELSVLINAIPLDSSEILWSPRKSKPFTMPILEPGEEPSCFCMIGYFLGLPKIYALTAPHHLRRSRSFGEAAKIRFAWRRWERHSLSRPQRIDGGASAWARVSFRQPTCSAEPAARSIRTSSRGRSVALPKVSRQASLRSICYPNFCRALRGRQAD
jgi:hypothetical protein